MAEASDSLQQTPKSQPIPILFQNDGYLIINKPFDLKINSDDRYEDTVERRLRTEKPNLVDQKVAHGFRFVHRLDFATSGVLCLALNKKAAGAASAAFQHGTVQKQYLALVRGHVGEAQLVLDSAIGRDSTVTDHCVMCTTHNPHCTSPRSAHTTLVLLEHGAYDGEPASKVLLIPKTGRTHQLRVHCCAAGHTVVGDYTYSGRQDTAPRRMMLHAAHLHVTMATGTLCAVTEDPFVPESDKLWRSDKVLSVYSDCPGVQR